MIRNLRLVVPLLFVAALGFPADASFFDGQEGPGDSVQNDGVAAGGAPWRVLDLESGASVDGVEVAYDRRRGALQISLPQATAASSVVLFPPTGFFADAENVGVLRQLTADIMVGRGGAELEIALVHQAAVPVFYNFGPITDTGAGIRTFVWGNPHYVSDVRNRELGLRTVREPSTYYRRVAAIVLRATRTPLTIEIRRLGIEYDRAVFQGPPW